MTRSPETQTIATWDVLQSIGFEPNSRVVSDVMPGLSFDFLDLELSASCCVNLSAGEVVLFGGVMAGQGAVAEVCFEMPRRLSSRRQCAAWIAWHLDRAAPGGVLRATRGADWLAEGRENQSLLPWVADLEAYEARPRCSVRREWLRLGLNTLGNMLATVGDEEPVIFGFDGTVLTMRCEEQVVALAGEGRAWPGRYRVEAGRLRRLPKRLMTVTVEVSVWDASLQIGSHRYEGVMDTEARWTRSSGAEDVEYEL